jgi:hypothetical protein
MRKDERKLEGERGNGVVEWCSGCTVVYRGEASRLG